MKRRSNRVPQRAPVFPAPSVILAPSIIPASSVLLAPSIIPASSVIPGLTWDPWIADQVRNDTGVTNDTGVRNDSQDCTGRPCVGYGL